MEQHGWGLDKPMKCSQHGGEHMDWGSGESPRGDDVLAQNKSKRIWGRRVAWGGNQPLRVAMGATPNEGSSAAGVTVCCKGYEQMAESLICSRGLTRQRVGEDL